MNKIEFKDLDNWLKIAIITAWVTAFIWVVAFLIGFIEVIIYDL